MHLVAASHLRAFALIQLSFSGSRDVFILTYEIRVQIGSPDIEIESPQKGTKGPKNRSSL